MVAIFAPIGAGGRASRRNPSYKKSMPRAPHKTPAKYGESLRQHTGLSFLSGFGDSSRRVAGLEQRGESMSTQTKLQNQEAP